MWSNQLIQEMDARLVQLNYQAMWSNQLVQEMDARLVDFNCQAMRLLVKNLFEHSGRRPLNDEDGFRTHFFKVATDR